MHILHGTWIPEHTASFVQTGAFYLWVETSERLRSRKTAPLLHPNHLPKEKLATFLTETLGIQASSNQKSESEISARYFLLPSVDQQPCPSPELARYREQELPETGSWQFWQIDCYCPTALVKTGTYTHVKVINIVKLLNELHFIALHNLAEIQLGADLLLWYYYTQFFKHIILQDHYIPALKARSPKEIKQVKSSKRKSASAELEICQGWEIVSSTYEAELMQYAELMKPQISYKSPLGY